MKCPVCKSEDIRPKLKKPIVYGGRNAIEYYVCQKDGVIFEETKNNPANTVLDELKKEYSRFE